MKKMLVVSIALLFSMAVNAAPAKSEKQAKQSVELRQSIFKLVKSNVGVLGAMNKGRVPLNPEILQKNGERLEQLSLMIEDYFATDTSGFDVDTGALNKIWKEQADFNSKAADLTKAAVALQAAAKSGDEGKYKSAIGGVFKTCKGCHDSYKAD
ncbi:c-type cytochrome [Paraglaciecola sp.]|uniref:c-type cytochrome n=1 Tax=Paraglaciecola sp. TaxID=1920173 RepID=UPI003EF5A982